MTVGAYAELLFDPNDLSQQALREVRTATAKDDTVRGALERALFAQRIAVISEARKRLALEQTLTPATVMRVLDYSWQVFAPRFVKIAGPQIALAYGRAFTAAQAGDIDNRYLTVLAEQHARRLGTYFHESSKEALMDGFNTYLNRKVATRAAIERALVSYGLTRRQTRGLAANTSLDTKVSSPMQIKQNDKSNRYISHSFSTRVSSFAEQEVHNLEMQAEQIAWTWLMEHDQAPKNAEKIWLTARDERTCKVCAPMHGKVVRADDRFVLPNDIKVWVPGVHPNCRCVVRFRVPRQLEIAKADRWDPKEHPRGGDPENRGRFSAANRRGPRFKEPEPELEVDLSGVEQAQREAEQLREIEEILAARTEIAPRQMVAPRQTVQPRKAVAPRTQEIAPREEVAAHPITARDLAAREVMARLTAITPIAPRELEQQLVERRADRDRKPRRPPLSGYNEKVQPLGQPFYAVLDPNDTGQLIIGQKIGFDSTRDWYASEGQAIEKAIQLRAEIIGTIFNKIRKKKIVIQPEDIDVQHSDAGVDVRDDSLTLEMDDMLASNLLLWLDNQGRKGGPKYTFAGEEVLLTSRDNPRAGSISVHMGYADLADYLDLSGEEFRVHIVEVDHGHKGETEVYPHSKPERATARITGQFEPEVQRSDYYFESPDVENLTHDVTVDMPSGQIPITIHKLNPILPPPEEDPNRVIPWNDDE